MSYILAACEVIPEITGLIMGIIEACGVVALCIVRIIKLVADIKAVRNDDNPDDAGQIKDLITGTIKDIKEDINHDNKK